MTRYHALMIFLGFAGFIVVGTFDARDQRRDEQQYCDMVRVWLDHASLPPQDRPGWPPYRNDVTCEE